MSSDKRLFEIFTMISLPMRIMIMEIIREESSEGGIPFKVLTDKVWRRMNEEKPISSPNTRVWDHLRKLADTGLIRFTGNQPRDLREGVYVLTSAGEKVLELRTTWKCILMPLLPAEEFT